MSNCKPWFCSFCAAGMYAKILYYCSGFCASVSKGKKLFTPLLVAAVTPLLVAAVVSVCVRQEEILNGLALQ